MANPYRAVLAARVRSQLSYRTSFATELLTAALFGAVEFVETAVLFANGGIVGGLTLPQIVLVFALAEIGFTVADLVVGHCDRLPKYLREGTLDTFFLRPQPILAQLMTSDISLHRLTRAAVGVALLVVALVINPIEWSAGAIAILLLAIACSTLIYAALFVTAAGVQFFLVNGPEFTNAFTYGGRYAGGQPASVWPDALKVTFGLLIPVAFTGYLPACWILGLPGAPPLLPAWAAWLVPVAAIWAWVLALFSWRTGLRHHTSAGG